MSQLLVSTSALILGLLGLAHMVLTFFGNRMHPRDVELVSRMQSSHPVITRDTTMWKAWLGFNASHSMGAMLFGAVYGYLAACQPHVLFESPYLMIVGCVMLLVFALLAKRYWFNIPRIGINLALVFYVIGTIMGVV